MSGSYIPSEAALSPEEQQWARHHFDATDVERMQDPYRIFEYLREHAPVTWSDAHLDGYWVVSRYEDVRAVARDHARFVSSHGMAIPPLGNERPMIPIETDPPDHRLYRLIINDLFTPSAVAAREERIRLVTRQLVDEIVRAHPNGLVDLVRAFSYEQPMRVMWAPPLLGTPTPLGDDPAYSGSVTATFQGWVHDFKHSPDATSAAAKLMRIYVEELLRDRKSRPQDDIPTRLLEADVGGRALKFDEAADFMFILFSAGTGTTGDAISGALLYLASDPGVRRALVTGQASFYTATEELIRYFGPAQAERRTAVEEVDLRGAHIRSGDPVQILWGSANRDGEVFASPNEVFVERDPNPHLSFGSGIHRCIGAHLAKAQVRIALEEWLSRVPDFGLSTDHVSRWSVGLDRSLQTLLVEW